MNSKTHARLSPSSSKRWMTCPGSIQLTEKLGIKSTSSFYASEGNVAHILHERCLSENKKAATFKNEKIKHGGIEFTVDDEMIDAVQMSVDHINSLIFIEEIKGYEVEMQLEVRCSLKQLKISGLSGGTSDVILLIWIPIGHVDNDSDFRILKRVDVIDYKHGAGVAVEVENNTQAMCYALGATLHIFKSGQRISEGINITISQPRAFHPDGKIRTWNISLVDLMKWRINELEPAAKKVLKPDAKLCATDEGCKFCPNIGQCPALFEIAQQSAKIEFSKCNKSKSIDAPVVSELTSEHKLFVMKNAKIIKKFLDELEKSVCQEIFEGSTDYESDFKLVNKMTKRKLNELALDVVSSPLLDHLSHDDIFKETSRTMSEIEKRLKKAAGVKECKKIMDAITIKSDGDLVVVPKSDKRKSALPTLISDFKDVV